MFEAENQRNKLLENENEHQNSYIHRIVEEILKVSECPLCFIEWSNM